MSQMIKLMKSIRTEVKVGQQKLSSELKGEMEGLRSEVSRQSSSSKAQLKIVADKVFASTVRVVKMEEIQIDMSNDIIKMKEEIEKLKVEKG